jgi:hypothetical protein
MALEPKASVGQRQVKFLGPFNLQHLLNGIRAFLEQRNYDIEDVPYKYRKGAEGFVLETKIKAKIKATPFVRKSILVMIRIDRITDIEITQEGKKVKLQHGRGNIEVSGEVEFGWQDFWRDHEKLLKWYLDYFYRQQYFGHWLDMHWYEVQDLASEVRRLLNFEVR